ncbi:alkaline phosphatase [Shewanella waksmanii]|uniref:alkaline phosphatase n=1 Tax=Shewanella waksmanii TaxID=213783 RepID=UPI003735FC2D
MKSISLKAALALAVSSFAPLWAHAESPRNIIFLIGDGMGPAYTSAYRYFNDDSSTKKVEKTIFDHLLVGASSTYPDDDTYVTDSAAAATALATGYKTYNGAISVDHQHNPISTMMEQATKAGYITAIVATSQVNHATPASFLAHNESRRNYNQIADSYADNLHNGLGTAELILGGGTQYFIRDDRNLISEFTDNGYQYIDKLNQLESLTKLPAIGLFAKSGMPAALGADEPRRLQKMTDKALQLLSRQTAPFMLMVEASQIDWCGHSNDIVCAMHEMDDFAHTLMAVKAFVDKHPDTLLIATADHSTGGLTLGRKGDYKWEGQQLKKVTVLPKVFAKQLLDNPEILSDYRKFSAVWHTQINLSIADDSLARLQQSLLESSKSKDAHRLMTNRIKRKIDALTYTGWTTSGHDGIDVPVFAYGAGKHHFYGHVDNTEIANKIISFIAK